MHIYQRFHQQWEKERRERARKRILVAVLLTCTVLLLLVSFQENVSSVTSPEGDIDQVIVSNIVDEGLQASLYDSGIPSAPGTKSVTCANTVYEVVRSGQSFSSIMSNHGFSHTAITQFVDTLAPLFNLHNIAAGNEYQITTDSKGDLLQFTIIASPIHVFTLSQANGKLVARKEEVVLEKKVETISGAIESSLFCAVAATREKDQLALEFADIFAWDIDFRNDLRDGDRFSIVLEKYFKGDNFIGYGNILAAEYRGENKTHRAIFFKDSQCNEDFFTPEGNSLRRSFVRSPLRFTRISSGYSHRRLHPVLRQYKPHLGVDFAAPVGTPVWAVGDGVITWKGWKNGNGNCVSIRHPNGYETMYNHLSRYGKGIQKRARVSQKDIIGYVGTTGLSTGPHLDYRMKKDGRSVNPLTEKFPPGMPVAESSRKVFFNVAHNMIALIEDAAPEKTVVAGEASSNR